MKRLVGSRVIITGIAIVVVLLSAIVVTALSGRMVKVYLEKASDRVRVDRISFGWGTIEGREVKILDSGQEVAGAKFVAIRPSLLTFFRKGYTLSQILVEEPIVALTITRNNRIVTPLSQAAGQEKRPATVFYIGSLDIRNGILSVNDLRPRAPAKLQAFNVGLSIGSFTCPLSDKSSTVRASGQLSGNVLSGHISSSGTVNLKTGAFALSCTAKGLNALQYGPKKPQLQVERLALKAESTGATPISIRDVQIENPYYRYSSDQKREITEALPGMEGKNNSTRDKSNTPVAIVRGVAVKKGEIVITNSADSKASPEISIVDVSLSIDQIPLPLDNTPSLFDLSGHIPGRQSTARLRWSGKTAFGTLETDSQLSLQSLDLTSLRPYLEKEGDAVVAKGTVDVQARVRIHKRNMDTPVTATIRHLKLAPSRGLKDQFMGVPRTVLLNSLKTRNNEIRIDFLVSGPIDSPSFSLRENMKKRFAIALARGLGLSAVGAGETVIEQGTRAVHGAGKGIKGLGEGVKRLFGQ